MHQIRSAPDLTGVDSSAPPDPLAGFKGPTSKARERERKGREKRKEGRGERGRVDASKY